MNRPNLKIVLSTIFILGLTLGGIFGFRMATSSFQGAQESLPFYLGAPQPYSYIVDTNGTHYFAYNGTTGQFDFQSTNKTLVQQYAIGNLTGGGSIYLKGVTLSVGLSYGSTILIIEDYQGQLCYYRNSLKLREIGDCPTATNGTFVLTSDTSEHTIVELTPSVVTYLYNFWLDLNALTQNCTIRVYSKIDGANYREILPMRLADLTPADAEGLVLKEQMISTAWKITIQSTVAEGASRNIPYRYFTEVWG